MIAALAFAFRILTIFAAPGDLRVLGADARRAVAAFPLVGALVGSIAGAVYVVASHFWPSPAPAAAALTLLAALGVTCGRGPAGVARIADGVASLGQDGDRPKALALVNDPRRGAPGIVAAGAVLIVRFALLASLPSESAWGAIVAAAAIGQWANAFGYAAFAPVRAYDDPESAREAQPGMNELMVATMLAIVFAAIRPVYGLAALLVAAIVIAPTGQSLARAFGGRTSYLAFALGETAELVALAICSARI